MSTSYNSYQRLAQTLRYSYDHFEEAATTLFIPGASQSEQELAGLKARWQKVLAEGSEMAEWVQSHHRVQTFPVLSSLEELAKYSDIRRPFRLSVIGQKGVGKSALVNALLGAPAHVHYTPSDVTGKALSGTRIRLSAKREKSSSQTDQSQPSWKVVFLTPQRLWEVGTFLLGVARLKLPTQPQNLTSRREVINALEKALKGQSEGAGGEKAAAATQIQIDSARKTLARMLGVYRSYDKQLAEGYTLSLDEADVEGPVSSYLRQNEDGIYLIVDWVERYLEPHEAGFLANRPLELEDVLGLDDPRDSFFALEAFKEAFAVVMVFKCDRGLGSETSAILERLFSREEAELAWLGTHEIADLNKAIIVANRFDEIVANVAPHTRTSPLKGVDDIRSELARYTRQANSIPIYLTSAALAQSARSVLQAHEVNGLSSGNRQGTGSTGASEDTLAQNATASSTAPGEEIPYFRPTAAYNTYLEGLANLTEVVVRQTAQSGQTSPEYLDFVLEKRGEIEHALHLPPLDPARARLITELSGLPRLLNRVEEALEEGRVLRSRVANSEYYYARLVSETASAYASHLKSYGLAIDALTMPSASNESRLFSRFQSENRERVLALNTALREEWFALSRRFLYGPPAREVEQLRRTFLTTIRRAVGENKALVQTEQQISTGELITDAWRRVFEDINDWLCLEAGRECRTLAGPLLIEIEKLAGRLQKELLELEGSALPESFWAGYRMRLARLRERVQNHAEGLAIGFYTDHRLSVYDEVVTQTLQLGDEARRKEEVSQLLAERVSSYFNRLWLLTAKVTMVELNAFVNELSYYVLGLAAERSLLVGLELARPGSGETTPQDSVLAKLTQHYHTDEAFRREYARREPGPAERLALEIREWLGLIHPPLDGLAELGRAFSSLGTLVQEDGAGGEEEEATSSGAKAAAGEEASKTATTGAGTNFTVASSSKSASQWPGVSQSATSSAFQASYTQLAVPVESLHPYAPVSRQFWDITNPDEKASATRLHFSRIDLGANNSATDRLVVESWGKKHSQIITGVHTDFWTEAFPGRQLRVRFTTDSTQPGWGFRLDGISTVVPGEELSTSPAQAS